MIKAVIFDLGNVIVQVVTSRREARLAKLCNLPEAEIAERIHASGLAAQFDRGRLTPEEFHREMCRHLGLPLSFESFSELWSDIFLPETLASEDLIVRLHRRHRLLLLSNTDSIHFNYVREHYPLLRHFDAFVLSYELGAAKPDPAIYREAVRLAGCAAGECLFTDDVEANVEAARKEGLEAVQFLSSAQFEADVRAYGILA